MDKIKIIEVDRFTYSESVQINIGDYENRSRFASYSSSIRKKNDKAILELKKMETKVRKEDETLFQLVKRVKRVVKNTLLIEESAIRKISENWVEFETLDKVPEKYE